MKLQRIVTYILSMLMFLTSSSLFAYSDEEINDYMRQNGFPDSNYPYYDKPNGCGSKENPHLIRDSWFGVRFKNDCYAHDYCYMTIGRSQNECDTKLLRDMRYSCNAQLTGLNNWKALFCQAAAAGYLDGTTIFGTLLEMHTESQRNQIRYKQIVENFINSEIASGNIINKIALRADNGQYLARCDGCIPGTSYSNIAFIHADTQETPYAQWDLMKLDNGKYALRADNGIYMARCDECIPRAAYPNSAFIHAQTAAASPAQWDLMRLDNGKYALRADNGSYLARCDGCAPRSAYPNIAFVHAADSSSRYAQWDMIIIH